MTTTEQRLADALRAILPFAERDVGELAYLACDDDSEDEAMDANADVERAREALAAYDAQQAQAHDVAAGAWSANAGSVWDHTGKWIADCNREHAARIVQCVNAHDALVSALRTILADKGSASFNDDLEAYDAAIQTASDALAQAGVNHA